MEETDRPTTVSAKTTEDSEQGGQVAQYPERYRWLWPITRETARPLEEFREIVNAVETVRENAVNREIRAGDARNRWRVERTLVHAFCTVILFSLGLIGAQGAGWIALPPAAFDLVIRAVYAEGLTLMGFAIKELLRRR